MEMLVSGTAQRLSVIQKMHELLQTWDGTSQTALEVVAEMKMLTAMLEEIQGNLATQEREYSKNESDMLLAIYHQQKLVHYVLKVARNRTLENLRELNQQGKMKEYIYKQNDIQFLDKEY